MQLPTSKAGIQPSLAPKLKRQLWRLDETNSASDMNVTGGVFDPPSLFVGAILQH
jgi:hypothetical protein